MNNYLGKWTRQIFPQIWVSFGALVMLLFFVVPAFSLPIPGSSNEVINPTFDNDWNAWEHSGVGIVSEGNPGPSVQCILPADVPHTLRQVIDESTNPLWNPSFHSKIIDLTVDIMADSDIDLQNEAKVSFRLDYWGEDQNDVNDPNLLPSPLGYSEWVPYQFTSFTNYQKNTWLTVNPFNRNSELFAIFQPRWVSLEISIEQSATDRVHLDNVILTSQCVPEPCTMLLLGTGLAGFVGYKKKSKKR